VEELFLALDTDCGGTIGLGEFLQLSDSTGATPERLTDIFFANDVNGSGSLDMQARGKYSKGSTQVVNIVPPWCPELCSVRDATRHTLLLAYLTY